jgi:hypothetical protein
MYWRVAWVLRGRRHCVRRSLLIVSPLALLEGRPLTPPRILLAKILAPVASVPISVVMVAAGGLSAYWAAVPLEEKQALATLGVLRVAAAAAAADGQPEQTGAGNKEKGINWRKV